MGAEPEVIRHSAKHKADVYVGLMFCGFRESPGATGLWYKSRVLV